MKINDDGTLTATREEMEERMARCFSAGAAWNRFKEWTDEHFSRLAQEYDTECHKDSPARRVARELLRRAEAG